MRSNIRDALIVLGFAVFALVYALKQDSGSQVQEPVVVADNDSAVMLWLTAFADHDFEKCDLLVQNSADRLYNATLYSVVVDDRYYNATLNGLVDCISAISVQDIVLDAGTGTYTVSVSYTPVTRIEEFVYDVNALNTAIATYESDGMTGAGFQDVLTEVYWGMFRGSCFNPSNEEVTLYLTLSEKNGYVYGTVGFVDSLLFYTNISYNLTVYEERARDTITSVLNGNL